MFEIYTIICRVFDFLFIPFQLVNPLAGLIAFSVLTGAVMLGLYRITSNQKALRYANDQIKRYFLEIRLYKDDFRASFMAIKKILKFNLAYMKLSLVPAMVMIIPVAFILIQLNLRYGYDPLRVEDKVNVSIILSDKVSLQNVDIRLEVPDGIAIETPPLRLNHDREVNWRLRVKNVGWHELGIRLTGKRYTKALYAGDAVKKLSPLRLRRDDYETFLYPGEPFLPEDSMVKSIHVEYPKKTFKLLIWESNWMVIFFGLSIFFGMIFKKLFKVA